MEQLKFMFLVLGTMLFILSGCNVDTSDSEMQFKKSVWDQLTESQKNEVIGGWRKAEVHKVVLTEKKMLGIKDKSYLNKEVYLINFKSKKSHILGDLGVYVEMETEKIIGGPLRD
ncbi:hypothetical protein AB1284_25515 [Bacillus sp. S2(2024)]|uniref:hypothetical protein n=1 Tax=Bacillus sp. S2(2024) TaxID=3162887 RepID=UPI003D1BF1D0